MDKIVLSIEDLAVDSFTASTESSSVIGGHHTGCIPGDCPGTAVTGCYC